MTFKDAVQIKKSHFSWLNRWFYYLFLFFQSAISLSAQNLGAMHRIGKLPNQVFETSGLVYFNNQILTINDSGNPPVVYGINTLNRQLTTTHVLSNAKNIDWEELSLYDSTLTIADIGNNYNTRDTFDLYSFPIGKCFETENNAILPLHQRFTIPNKASANFNSFPLHSAFDMEAIVRLDTAIFIFSKNWITARSNVYIISGTQNMEIARCIDSLPFKGLVTGSCILPNKTFVFVGYHHYIPFVALCQWDGKIFSLISIRRFYGHWACQTEGICYAPSIGLIISAEETSLRKSACYRIKLK